MPTNSPLAYSKPSLLRRLAAIFYDSILLMALLILFSIPWVMVTSKLNIESKWGLRFIFLSLLFGFYVYFWLRKQQTLGMTTWRIKLVNAAGNRPTGKQCVIRLLTAGISIICLGLGYLWMFIDKEQMTWHDRLSNTELILLPKKNK